MKFFLLALLSVSSASAYTMATIRPTIRSVVEGTSIGIGLGGLAGCYSGDAMAHRRANFPVTEENRTNFKHVINSISALASFFLAHLERFLPRENISPGKRVFFKPFPALVLGYGASEVSFSWCDEDYDLLVSGIIDYSAIEQ